MAEYLVNAMLLFPTILAHPNATSKIETPHCPLTAGSTQMFDFDLREPREDYSRYAHGLPTI
jgi:hypothetical protein